MVSSPQSVVELDRIRRYYELRGETVRALDDVSLAFGAGEFAAIAGPSGSGKSTLLNLIGALDRPTSGRVLIDGRDVGTMNGRELAELRRDRIGFVFQSFNLIPVLTAAENAEYVLLLRGVAPDERRRKAMEMLEEVGLAGLGDRRPAELSGGQQQRVAVARALAGEPALVLADEPTANLDTATGAGLLETMAELNRLHGTTFLFSTHDPRVMERASRLIRLRDGRVESDERR